MNYINKQYITVKIKDGVSDKRWYANIKTEIKAYHYGLSPYGYCVETDRQIDLNDCEIIK